MITWYFKASPYICKVILKPNTLSRTMNIMEFTMRFTAKSTVSSCHKFCPSIADKIMPLYVCFQSYFNIKISWRWVLVPNCLEIFIFKSKYWNIFLLIIITLNPLLKHLEFSFLEFFRFFIGTYIIFFILNILCLAKFLHFLVFFSLIPSHFILFFLQCLHPKLPVFPYYNLSFFC